MNSFVQLKSLLLALGCFVLIGGLLPSSTSFAEAKNSAWEMIQGGALVVDVRTTEEFSAGHIAGAINVPYDQVAQRIAEFGSEKQREIVVYCKSGRRASVARETLVKSGFENVFNAGGYTDLAASQPSTLK